ncbi:MAG TPA: RHS repeat-associated core domain-containing protein [Verrucomicrobiae bacterium]|nr:RHS repeat-associated core domain-containing protein [Verrucomicrobiae bacterium]HUN63792.1 RHS repeat-associated core domain-containing protein [Candidatus Sulfotelmatobacter sp.]
MRRDLKLTMLIVGMIGSLATARPSVAQSYLYGFGSYPWSVPLPVPDGYVDAANGNLHVDIPLVSMPERGRIPFLAKLSYDSHIWQQVSSSGGSSWQPTNVPALPTVWGGWRLITTAGTGSGVTYTIGSGVCYTRDGNLNLPHVYLIYEDFQWTAPDGHSIPFGAVTIQAGSGNPCETNEPSSGGIARDASGYHISVTNYTSAIVYAPDGTQIYPNVKDTNGNYYSAPDSSGDVTDTLGRTPITTTTNGSTITYAVSNSAGGSYDIVVTTESIPVNTAFGQSGVTEYSGNITVIQSIALPDGSSYQFAYDQGSTGAHYGYLKSITLPTGGAVTFNQENFKDAYGNQNLYVTSVSAAGGTWSYSPQVLSSCGTTCSEAATVTQPSGDQEIYDLTMYSGEMWLTLSSFYSGSSTLLTSTAITYNTSDPPYIQPINYTTTVPIPGGNLKSQKTITWDTTNLGNVTTISEWRFYSGSFPQTADRTTSYTYLTNSDNNMINKKTSISMVGNFTSGSTTINYDAYSSGQPALVTGVSGHDDTNFGQSYTARGNPTSVVTGFGTTTMTYDTTGQLLTSTDPNSNLTQFSYADNFFNDSGTAPTGSGANTPSGTTAPQPTNAYVTSITPAMNGPISMGYYFGSGKLAVETDQNHVTSVFHYLDGSGWDRPSASFLPGGEWLLSSYASENEIDSYKSIATTNASTGCSSCTHNQITVDAFGRIETSSLISDPEGQDTITAAYDSNSRLESLTNPERSTSNPTDGTLTFAYDGINRTTQVADPDGSVAKVYYGTQVTSAGGNSSQACSATIYGSGVPTLYIDEAGKKRQTWIEGFGNVMEVDEPDPANGNSLDLSTCYEFNALNQLIQVSQGSQTRTYGVNSLGQVYTENTAESGIVDYYYTTATGGYCSGVPTAVCRRKDARGTTTTYTYDKLNRLTGKSYSDSTPSITYSYDQSSANGLTITDGIGRMTSMADGSGSAAWSYYANGLIQTEKRTIGTVTNTLSYAYNLDGSLASVTYPSGRTVTYTVGNADRSTSATDLANNIKYAATASYAPTGDVNGVIYGLATGFNGIAESRSYNNRLEFNAISASSTAGTAESLTYNYVVPTGNNGSVNSITNGVNSGLSENFLYDSLNRILSAATSSNSASGCWGESFGPSGTPPPGPADDRWSNLTEINLTQCSGGSLGVGVNTASNQLNTTGYAYDLAGNMTSEGNSYTYTFDAENHLTSAVGPLTDGYTYCYVYDGNGLRVEKYHISSGTCAEPGSPIIDKLYWRAITGQTIAETDGSGNVLEEYVFFAGRRIAQRSGTGAVNYLYTDQVGSVIAMTDGSGNSCYQSTFTPYGEEHATQSTCSTTYKFTGYERDEETGLDYAFARYYNQRLGRFMSADPLAGAVSNPQTLNRYAYVGNNPPNNTDPLGLYCAVRLPCPSQPFDPSYGFGADFEGVGWIGQPWGTSWETMGVCGDDGCTEVVNQTPYGFTSNGPGGDAGGGVTSPKSPCAPLEAAGGGIINATPFGSLIFNSNGALVGLTVGLTGDSPEQVGSVVIPSNTSVTIEQFEDESVSVNFSNPINSVYTYKYHLFGFSISGAQFANGQFTQVEGAPTLFGIPFGSTSTGSSNLTNQLNQNQDAIDFGNLVTKVLQFMSTHITCEELFGGG